MSTEKSKTTETAMTADPLLGVVISGCKFKYASYDFKKAMLEFIELNPQYQEFNITDTDLKKMCSEYMPKELKEKYRVWKIGKLRKIHFNPNGRAFKYEIGAKYARTFYAEDFGVQVFPIV